MEWTIRRRLYRGAVRGRDVARAATSLVLVLVAFVAAAWIAGAAPFEGKAPAPYSETGVMRALPFDALLPYDIELAEARFRYTMTVSCW